MVGSCSFLRELLFEMLMIVWVAASVLPSRFFYVVSHVSFCVEGDS